MGTEIGLPYEPDQLTLIVLQVGEHGIEKLLVCGNGVQVSPTAVPPLQPGPDETTLIITNEAVGGGVAPDHGAGYKPLRS